MIPSDAHTVSQLVSFVICILPRQPLILALGSIDVGSQVGVVTVGSSKYTCRK